MLLIVRRSLAGHWRRSVGLFTGLLVAVSGFIVLTSTVETSRLDLVGTVEEHSRPTYDVLVRPRDSASALESDHNLVRSGFLADSFGGITLEQVERIRAVPGVQVAAPIAVVGFAEESSASWHPAGDLVPSQRRSLFRIRERRVVDSGLTQLPERVTYAYFTPYGLRPVPGEDRFVEELPDGATEASCLARRDGQRSLLEPAAYLTCSDLASEPHFVVEWGMPMLLAAVDPAAEAELFGLDQAVVQGSYFAPSGVQQRQAADEPGRIPILVARDAAISAQSHITVEQLPADAAHELPARMDDDPPTAVVDMPGSAVTTYTIDQDDRYDEITSNMVNGLQISRLWQPGPVEIEVTDDQLHPRPAPEPDWTDLASGITSVSLAGENGDTPFRELTRVDNAEAGLRAGAGGGQFINGVLATWAGQYNTEQLTVRGELSGLSMAEYFSPSLPGADATTRDLLEGEELRPNAALTGYLQAAPRLLTTIGALPVLFDEFEFGQEFRAAPVSAVRVRAADVSGVDAVDRERVRLVAEEIERRTGLQVDVVMGSSTAPRDVVLPAGDFGRPQLTLAEPVSVKGVVAVIHDAIERKSLLLFGLVLVVCALFVANAAAAAVRTKRAEFGVLAAVGWPRRSLFLAVLAELGVLSLLAGGGGVVMAWLGGTWLGLEPSWSRALLAVPVSLLVALAAGFVPAWRAARAEPMDAIRPPAVAARRPMRRPSQFRLAAAAVRRVPGRTLLGVSALAVATAALTLVVSIAAVFQGQVTGTLLGDAITVQVSAADVAATAAMLLLSVVTVADILYLDVRDRMSEFAVLAATGWTSASIARLVASEAAIVGVAGGVCGAVVGVAATVALAGPQWLPSLLPLATLLVASGLVVAVIASAVPIRVLQRQPLTPLLASE